MMNFQQAREAIQTGFTVYADEIEARIATETAGVFFARKLGITSGVHGMVRARQMLASLPADGSVMDLVRHVAETRSLGKRSREVALAAFQTIFENTRAPYDAGFDWRRTVNEALLEAENNGGDEYLATHLFPKIQSEYDSWVWRNSSRMTDDQLMMAAAVI